MLDGNLYKLVGSEAKGNNVRIMWLGEGRKGEGDKITASSRRATATF